MPAPALLSDIGNVLVSFDFTRAADAFARRSRCARDEVLALLEPLKEPLESGRLPGAEFVRRGMALIGHTGTADEFRHGWCDIFTENPRMAQTLAALPRALPRHMLSNTNDLHKEFLLATFPIFRQFSGGVYSYLAASMKPEERIFRVAIAQLDLEPALTFYIDDLPANIATARRLGFVCHHYDAARHDLLQRELDAWLATV